MPQKKLGKKKMKKLAEKGAGASSAAARARSRDRTDLPPPLPPFPSCTDLHQSVGRGARARAPTAPNPPIPAPLTDPCLRRLLQRALIADARCCAAYLPRRQVDTSTAPLSRDRRGASAVPSAATGGPR